MQQANARKEVMKRAMNAHLNVENTGIKFWVISLSISQSYSSFGTKGDYAPIGVKPSKPPTDTRPSNIPKISLSPVADIPKV